MKKAIIKVISIVLCMLMVCSITGCDRGKTKDENEKASAIQVVDSAGRTVTFDEPAKTVATSWGGGVDSYIYALGVSDRIVATNSKHDFDKLFFNPETMAKVGKWSLDKEALAEVKPDLYLHGAAATEYLEGANEIGVKSYGMGFNTYENVIKNLEDLGKIFGVEERAARVVNHCNSIIKLVDDRVSQIPENERYTVVVLGEKTGELSSDIYATVEVMMDRAGGVSCTPEDIRYKTETTVVGLESIFEWNPDVIFLQDYKCELTVDSIMSDPMWAPMTAVKNEKVFAIPCTLDAWYKPGASCYLGTLYMSMKMYPELYEDINFEEIVFEFYKEVYDLNLEYENFGVME